MDSTSQKYKEPVGFSKLDTFRECPARFKYQFMEKRPQPSSPALARGSEIHDNCEAYIRGWDQELKFEHAEHWQEAFDHLKSVGCKTEAAWGISKDWDLLPNWFHQDTWLRAKSDAHYQSGEKELTVIDFKTGQYRVPSTEQVELYAICSLSAYPGIEKVKAEFWFLDTDKVYTKEYTAEELKALRKKYEDYFSVLFAEERWAPTPSRGCRWCAYSSSKGGPCQY